MAACGIDSPIAAWFTSTGGAPTHSGAPTQAVPGFMLFLDFFNQLGRAHKKVTKAMKASGISTNRMIQSPVDRAV
jgi:hypothetical protein